jgi:hypothetical protein
VLGVVKHVDFCADCLGGDDERVLRHVAAVNKARDTGFRCVS